MSKIVWNETAARWFRDAAEYTQFNKKLASLLLELIPQRGTLCDIGCGLALTDIELARHFERVTCVDKSAEAVELASRCVEKSGLSNIEVIKADGRELEGQWDAVITLFHGTERDFTGRYPRLARGTFVAAVHEGSKDGQSITGRKVQKPCTADTVTAALNDAKINYTAAKHSLEYGQPLRSLVDGMNFLRAYSDGANDAQLYDRLNTRVVETGHKDLPYYLPAKKRFSLIKIPREANPQL